MYACTSRLPRLRTPRRENPGESSPREEKPQAAVGKAYFVTSSTLTSLPRGPQQQRQRACTSSQAGAGRAGPSSRKAAGQLGNTSLRILGHRANKKAGQSPLVPPLGRHHPAALPCFPRTLLLQAKPPASNSKSQGKSQTSGIRALPSSDSSLSRQSVGSFVPLQGAVRGGRAGPVTRPMLICRAT